VMLHAFTTTALHDDKHYLPVTLFTYSTHSMGQDIIWKADCHSACEKILLSYGTRRFITVFTKISPTGPYPEPAESIRPIDPYLPKVILILSSHLRLGLPSGLLPLGLPTKTL
jgi:hypothetical protein